MLSLARDEQAALEMGRLGPNLGLSSVHLCS
jgi:hypothetical protein